MLLGASDITSYCKGKICETCLRLSYVILFGHQGLAAFLKAIGYLIPLMDAEYANYYTREVMLILIREFQSPDEEMKKIVLKVRRQSVRKHLQTIN